MGITTAAILDFDYVAFGFFGVLLLVGSIMAFYYSLKGYNRMASVLKYSSFVMFFLMFAAHMDAITDGFVFTRLDDFVTVSWFRRFITILVFPLSFLAFFQVLHSPTKEDNLKKGATKPKMTKMDVTNPHEIWSNCQWVIIMIAFISSAFNMGALLTGWLFFRWLAYAASCLAGIASFIMTYLYVYYFGIIYYSHNEGMAYISKSFKKAKNKQWSIFIAWVLLLLVFIASEIMFALGHAMGQFISYDMESLSYLIIELVLAMALILLAVSSRHAQHRSSYDLATIKAVTEKST